MHYIRSGLIAGLFAVLTLGCADGPTAPDRIPATIEPNSAVQQYATVASNVSILPSVIVRDSLGRPLAGVLVTFELTTGDGIISGATATSDAAGVASLGGLTTGPTAGRLTVKATVSTLHGKEVVFQVTVLAAGFRFRSLVTSDSHTCGISETDVAYCWGSSAWGLGDGTIETRLIPTRVAGTTSFASIVSHGIRTCALTSTGAAYCWGYDAQIAECCSVTVKAPTAVTGGLSFRSLTSGGVHSCGLTSVGQAYCWGDNRSGQLGDGTYVNRADPTPVSGGLTFRSLTAGTLHTCGIAITGETYCWGDNLAGQLGDGTKTEYRTTPVAVSGGIEFQMISAGYVHTCGLTSTGAAYCWGFNGTGNLGDESLTTRLIPVPVAGGQLFTSIEAGYFATCALTATGDAYCWGDNRQGQLGDGTLTSRSVPVPSASGLKFQSISTFGQTCGLTVSKNAYCWGDNFDGAIGNGTTQPRANPDPVQVSNPQS
jgi:hypothetical protein